MATRYLNLRALAVVFGCASLLPMACSGDDDSGNPTPGTGGKGGSSGEGGTSGKGGSGAKGGSGGNAGVSEGGATTGGTSAGGKGGTSAGGKGGSSAGKGGKGGTTGGTGAEAGTAGGSEAGTGGTGPMMHECTDDDEVTYNCGTTAHPVNIKCFSGCTPPKTDDSEYFLNRCPDEPSTVGGVTAACQPWTTVLTKLGPDCTAQGPGCTLPDLP